MKTKIIFIILFVSKTKVASKYNINNIILNRVIMLRTYGATV